MLTAADSGNEYFYRPYIRVIACFFAAIRMSGRDISRMISVQSDEQNMHIQCVNFNDKICQMRNSRAVQLH